MNYQIVLTYSEGWYIADVPSLPGCMSQGKTEEEALENVKDAIKGYLKVLKKHHREIPSSRLVEIGVT